MKKIKSKWGDTLESMCWNEFGSYDQIYDVLKLNPSLVKHLYIPTGSRVLIPEKNSDKKPEVTAQKRFIGETKFQD